MRNLRGLKIGSFDFPKYRVLILILRLLVFTPQMREENRHPIKNMKVFIIEKSTLTIRPLNVARFDRVHYGSDAIPHTDELSTYLEFDRLIEEQIAKLDAEAKEIYGKKLAASNRIEEIKQERKNLNQF